MRKAFWVISSFLFAAAASSAAPAPATPVGAGKPDARTSSTLRALLVGVSDYMDDGVGDLRVAAKDARDLAAVIQDPAIGGWPPSSVEVLTDSQATLAKVNASLRTLVSASQPGDLLLVYFSGHSMPKGGKTSLALADTTLKAIEATSLDLDELRRLLSPLSPERRVLVVLDTHHAGLGDWPPGQTVLAASGVGETAMEQAHNGAFTGLLLRALRGEARNAKGEVTLRDVHAFIKAQALPGQTVQMVGSLPGDTVLAIGTQASAAVSGD